MWEYRASVERVIDADTLEVQIDLGFHIYTVQHVRVLNLNCPEKNTEAGREAIAFAKMVFQDHSPEVIIRTEYDRSFARFLAHVMLSNGRDYAEFMKTAGMGV